MLIENLKFCGTGQVAQILCISAGKVRSLIDDGDLVGYRIGADYKVAERDLADYIERSRVKPRA